VLKIYDDIFDVILSSILEKSDSPSQIREIEDEVFLCFEELWKELSIEKMDVNKMLSYNFKVSKRNEQFKLTSSSQKMKIFFEVIERGEDFNDLLHIRVSPFGGAHASNLHFCVSPFGGAHHVCKLGGDMQEGGGVQEGLENKDLQRNYNCNYFQLLKCI